MLRLLSTCRYVTRQYSLLSLVAILLIAVSLTPSANAQCSTWQLGASGAWNTAGNWTLGVPNSSTNGCIVDGSSTVTINVGTASVLDLTTASGNTLAFGGQNLQVYGASISNGGTLNNNGYLELETNVTLSGSGALTLTSGQIGTNSNNFTLTNQSTINGSGTIGSNGGPLYENLSVNNSGTINANSNGNTLTLGGNGSAVTNTGTLEATNGGTLALATSAAIDNNSGTILSSGTGSTVNVSTTIQGGTLTTAGGGVMQTSGTAGLDASSHGAITLSDGSTYTAAGGSITNISGTLNLGTTTGSTFLLNGSSTTLVLTGNTTLQGPGTVSMGGGNIGTNSNNFTLTNSSTINGYGTIGSNYGSDYENLSLTNNGVINANSSGNTLTIGGDGSAIANNGTFEATGGGTLTLSSNAAIDNVNGTIASSGSGSTVNVSTTITGGSLATSAGGAMQTSGTATLDGSGNHPITFVDGTTYTAAGGSVTNVTGTFNLGTTTGSVLDLNGATTTLVLTGNTTFQGPGSIAMAGGNIGTNSNDFTLTNNSTINGYGTIGSNYGSDYENLSLTNNGVINANSSGNTLTIGGDGSAITNNGTFEATGGGILTLNSNAAINNASGTIASLSSGSLVNVGTTIQGGSLVTTGAGVIQTDGTATLDGSASHAITITDGSTYTAANANGDLTRITGTLNLGTVTGGTLALIGQLQLIGDTTFQGPGVVTMTGAPTGPENGTGAQIGTNSNNFTLTNMSTIQGSGLIGSNVGALYPDLNVLNMGTIDANSTANALEIGGNGTITNQSLFEATAGGTLILGSQTVNNSGGNITSDGAGSQVQISSSHIEGGTLNTLNGGTMVTLGTSELDGSTHGALIISDGSLLTSGAGTFTTVTGTLNLGTVTGGTYAMSGDLQLVGNTTLSGPGSMNLSGAAQIGTNGNNFTLTNNSTIQGTGLIGSNAGSLYENLNVTNNGSIIASGGVLNVAGNGTLTNGATGVLEAQGGATLHVSNTFSSSDFSGGTLSNGSYEALGAGSTIQINSLGTSGGEIATNAANIVLSGAGAAIVDADNLNALSDFHDNLADGSFIVENGNQFVAPSGVDFTNAGSVDVGAGSSFTTGVASNYVQSAGSTQVDGTMTSVGGAVNIDGGTLDGNGTVVGNVTIGANGTLAPGDPGGIGAIHLTGNATIDGTLDEAIGGTGASGNFDVTTITGTLTLGANSVLDLMLVDNYLPAVQSHESYVIIDPASISGTFGETLFPNLPVGDTYSVIYTPTEVIVDINGAQGSAVPEPTVWYPVAGIGILLAALRLRKQRLAQ